MRFSVDTKASPEQVLRALTDFSDRRPQIWSKTLDPKVYELRELGDTWAVAKEGTAGSPFWVVERYDWSDPTVVRWTDVDSSLGGLGSGEIRIVPASDGGSRLAGRLEQRRGQGSAQQDHDRDPPPAPAAPGGRAVVAGDARPLCGVGTGLTWSPRVAVPACLVAVLLAGCGGDPSPKPVAAPSTPASSGERESGTLTLGSGESVS